MSEATKQPDAKMVDIVIDDKKVSVPEGTMLLDAARLNGFHIPTLCYHEDLSRAGECRLCVVEIEGQRALTASCAFPVTAPIKVKTSSQRVRESRRHSVELLLSEHCGDCYACNRNENCELQDLAKECGISSFPFGHPTEKRFAIE